MRKLLIIFCCSCLFTACFQPERNCEDYRTGTFEFQSYLNGEIVTSRFIRNDSIEIDEFQGSADTSSVRWINDCEYILKNLHPKNRQERKPIHMKILTTNKNGYTFEYGVVGETRREKGSVTKVD
ncbi:DNA topoisomerase IV [Zunongwangia sp. F363]|uniref:DNA topoisomerase IV n=1 Tax=Autumnicola tepida TaxID=3075595 RepID=A0ABU3CCM2_9FLAO|nr:DNA topoisomerase IV [Zunongwangia sp. F363]MDT0644085.1 DNA topoisomerase IV [Zunongwangia sp. F363]